VPVNGYPYAGNVNGTSPYSTLNQYDGEECVYPFGLDPAWFLDQNNILTVQDCFKMKLAVIIGVAHMTMGICTKGLNAVYHKQYLVLWTEVVTGLIILLGLFGWMDILIIAKWLYPMNPYSMNSDMFTRINQAPSVITVMINNFLAGGNQEFILGDESSNVFFFNGQK